MTIIKKPKIISSMAVFIRFSVGVFKNGRVEIIANDQGNRITPSYVAFTEDNERLIGDSAKNQLTSNPTNTLFDIKRLIGREFRDRDVQEDISRFPFKVINKQSKPYLQVMHQGQEMEFAPEEISAMVVAKMKETAEAFLGTKVTHAVITVPAYFNDAQRQSTKDAGTIAGLTILRIINEPTAAAIAYGLDRKGSEKNIIVFDLGGGTFDVSLLTIDNGVFEVIATSGDTHLGGEDFDHRVIEHFLKLNSKKTGVDASADKRAFQKLRREVEKAKRVLSVEHVAQIDIDGFYDGNDFSETLTRARFEDLNSDLFKKTLEPIAKVMRDSKLEKKDIDEIVLVGGSTRIPKIQQMVRDFFDGKEPHRGINPDEAIAYGAAVQAGVMGGKEATGSIVLLDVSPLTLGIETIGGVMSKIIPRNTVIPARKSKHFSTTYNYQDAVEIVVYEGERPEVKNNHYLGKFELTGIPPAPRGIPSIEVTFDIDVNGILRVFAMEKRSGKRNNLVINKENLQLKPDEIERMINDAEKFAEIDKKIKDALDMKSELEGRAFSLKNQLSNTEVFAGKLSDNDRNIVERAVQNVLNWLDNNPRASVDEYKKQKTQLEETVDPVLSRFYQREEKDEYVFKEEL